MIKILTNLVNEKINTKHPVVKRLFNGMVWNLSGTILSKVFTMIASIMTARILGVDKNGEYGVINSTVLMFSTFAGLGLGITATRFVSEYKINNKAKCGRVIGMTNLMGVISGCIMVFILMLLAPWLASEQLNAPHLTLGLRLASVLLITNTLSTIQQSTLSGFEKFENIAKLSIIQGIITLPVFVVFTYLFGVNGLIFGNIIVSLIAIILYAKINGKIRKEYGINMDVKGSYKEINILWKFSLPSMLANIMFGPITWIGNTFIISIPNGYYELGIFNAANQWKSALTFIPTAIGSVILPIIIANKGEERLERVNILFGWIVVLCIAIPLLAAPEIITSLYGKDYLGDAFNISILLIVHNCCILSYKEGIGRNLVSNNLMWWGVLSNTLWGISFLISLWFVREWGAIGLAAAYLVAYIISTIIFVPFYINRGVVHRSLIISKEVLLMWCALVIQLLGTAISSNIIIRILTFVISVLALWKVVKTMLKKENFQ